MPKKALKNIKNPVQAFDFSLKWVYNKTVYLFTVYISIKINNNKNDPKQKEGKNNGLNGKTFR